MATTEHDTPGVSAGAQARHLLFVRSGERAALRSALAPSRDLLPPGPAPANADAGPDRALALALAHCEVLDVAPALLSEDLGATLRAIPALRTVRLASDGDGADADRDADTDTGADTGAEPVRVSAFPRAETLVYLSAPETLVDLRPRAGSTAPLPVCAPDTRRLVLNFAPDDSSADPADPAGRASPRPRPRYRPKARRPGVERVVCVLHDGAGAAAHPWINWAVRHEIETTVVLCGAAFAAARVALAEQVDLHHIHVLVLSADEYRAQVGEDAFAVDTARFLSPEEEEAAAAAGP